VADAIRSTEKRIKAGEFKRGSLDHLEALYRETQKACEAGQMDIASACGAFEAIAGMVLDKLGALRGTEEDGNTRARKASEAVAAEEPTQNPQEGQ